MTSPSEITVMTVFGPAIIKGPFAQDYCAFKWHFEEEWWGEWARYRAAGLEVYAQDCDGDRSFWTLRDLKTSAIIAEGEDHGFSPPHFWKCLADAEAALRAEVRRRLASRAQSSRGVSA